MQLHPNPPGYQACAEAYGQNAAAKVATYINGLKLPYEPSLEQWLFLGWIVAEKGSCVLEAVAGSGKTASLILAVGLMEGDVFLGAFNKDIATELKQRIPPQLQWRVQAATMHSAGMTAIKNSGRRPRTEPGKLRFLLKDHILKGYRWEDPETKAASNIVKLVSLAKQHGFDVVNQGNEFFPFSGDRGAWMRLIDHFDLEAEWPKDISAQTIISLAKDLLELSNRTEAMIDFDDMIYLPLLYNYRFQLRNWVLLDEAQDTNAVRREMAFRMLKQPRPQPCRECNGLGCTSCINSGNIETGGGRLVAVGDPHQAIYGFTGADAHALDNIRRRAKAVTLPLSVSWRCASSVVAHARRVVSHIHAAPGALEGSVSQCAFDEHFVSRLQPGDAVLCRLNRPNVATAIACLRANKPARIVGRDLGQRLLAHARRAAPDKPGLLDLGPSVDSYQTAEVARLTKNNKESSIPFFEDEIEALLLLMDRCIEEGKQGYGDLEALCNYLFIAPEAQANAVIFSSVHKSKGLEWPRVYLLGRSDYMPFFMATQDWELEQEQNLIYVAITRAKLHLVEVTDVRSAIDTGLHRRQKLAEGKEAERKVIGSARTEPFAPPAFLKQRVALPVQDHNMGDADHIKGVDDQPDPLAGLDFSVLDTLLSPGGECEE